MSLPQPEILRRWIEGVSHFTLSLPEPVLASYFSPLTTIRRQLDANECQSLRWSLDVVRDKALLSFRLSWPDTLNNHLSVPDTFHLRLSLEDLSAEPIFALTDPLFAQTFSLSSNDLKGQLLSLVDVLEKKQNFGRADDDRDEFTRFSPLTLLGILPTLSPSEILRCLYSPDDVKAILVEHLLVDSDEISARAFRRFRCKHMSIRGDENDQLDSREHLSLLFRGNESDAIGEEHIQTDLDEDDEHVYRSNDLRSLTFLQSFSFRCH